MFNRGTRTRLTASRGGAEEPAVTWSAGIIRLRNPRLFGDPCSGSCRTFVGRILALSEVVSVEIDRRAGTAAIRYAPEALPVGAVLERVAGALRNERIGAENGDAGPVPHLDPAWPVVKTSRYGGQLSTWEVVHELPGRVRLRHEALRTDRELARQIAHELATVHGVEACDVKPLTASLLVRFDASAITTRQLVEILQDIQRGAAVSLACTGDPHPPAFALPNASVGLAAVGELALPALLPASAALLVVPNLTTFREAWRELRARQPGLPVLYTTIIIVTLSSGQFLAAALMSWMLTFWRRQHRESLLATRRRLLPGIAQHRRFARVCTSGMPIDVALERLKPRDVVAALAGEIVPADGLIVGGCALVDERLICGVDGLTAKRPGDELFAGSCIVEGEARLEVTRAGGATRAAAIARALLAESAHGAASRRMAVTDQGETFARRAVVPTLATAGLGLMVGDLTTAAAVLRPDYATGPGLGSSLEWLHELAACAAEGVLVRDATALHRLAEVDVVLIDDHPALERTRLELAAIVPMNGETHDTILQHAGTAYRDLAGEPARALAAACEDRRVAILEVPVAVFERGVRFEHEGRQVRVEKAARLDRGPARQALGVFVGGELSGHVVLRRNGRLAAEAAIGELRARGIKAIGLLSARPEGRALAEQLGLDAYDECTSAAAKADVIRAYRARGARVAYVGNGSLDAQVAREATVAISLSGELDREQNPAHLILQPGDLARIAGVIDRARSHVARIRAVHGSTVIPNVLCVAGAFLLGFTSMASVVITNLGTLGVYSSLRRRWHVPRSLHNGGAAPRRLGANPRFETAARVNRREAEEPRATNGPRVIALPSSTPADARPGTG